MPENVTNELLYEVLKQLQAGQVDMKASLTDHTRQFIGLREQLHTMEGNFLRQERLMATLENRIERIETRLGLSEAPH